MTTGTETNHGEILVVDDTSANLKLLMELLQTQGYKVRPATAGKLAIAAVEARKPDLILLDIKMPALVPLSSQCKLLYHRSYCQ